MADKSKIEWTEATWNPITGCSVVSRGCRNCYAMKLAGGRLRHHPSRAGLTDDSKAGPVWNGEVRFYSPWLDQPLRWKRPRHIFVCAHGDLFYEGVPDDWIDRVFAVMALAPQHTFQVLTKRPQRMRAYCSTIQKSWRWLEWENIASDWGYDPRGRNNDGFDFSAPHEFLPNVWLGVSAEDQTTANQRIPVLLDTPAAVRFLSAEPLVGPVDWTRWLPSGRPARRPDGTKFIAPRFNMMKCELCGWVGSTELCPHDDQDVICAACNDNVLAEELPKLDWVIAGGESGRKASPSHPDWFRRLRDQCGAAGVPFFFKQWGAFAPAPEGATHPLECDPVPGSTGVIRTRRASDGTLMQRVGKKSAGRLLDGREHNDMPSLATEARP